MIEIYAECKSAIINNKCSECNEFFSCYICDFVEERYQQGRADAIKELPTSLYCDGYNDGYKALHKEFKDSFEELNRLMCEYFEKWDTRKELTELEKLALHIVTIGMQDLSAFIDKSKDAGEVSF